MTRRRTTYRRTDASMLEQVTFIALAFALAVLVAGSLVIVVTR